MSHTSSAADVLIGGLPGIKAFSSAGEDTGGTVA